MTMIFDVHFRGIKLHSSYTITVIQLHSNYTITVITTLRVVRMKTIALQVICAYGEYHNLFQIPITNLYFMDNPSIFTVKRPQIAQVSINESVSYRQYQVWMKQFIYPI